MVKMSFEKTTNICTGMGAQLIKHLANKISHILCNVTGKRVNSTKY